MLQYFVSTDTFLLRINIFHDTAAEKKQDGVDVNGGSFITDTQNTRSDGADSLHQRTPTSSDTELLLTPGLRGTQKRTLQDKSVKH